MNLQVNTKLFFPKDFQHSKFQIRNLIFELTVASFHINQSYSDIIILKHHIESIDKPENIIFNIK